MPSHHYSRIASIVGILLGGFIYWWLASLALFAAIVVAAILTGIYLDRRLHSLIILVIANTLVFASSAAVILLGWGYQFGATAWCLIPVVALLVDTAIYGSRGDQRNDS
ncbi:hypothetical protein [Salinibius halmophilus]|uniref:hypothetical protein n=1 Tax=Salinibius halmophilus TaxID=1853216 RepID=UPI000E66172A|nr:hypothetical protein [Salinibius halmophilus]